MLVKLWQAETPALLDAGYWILDAGCCMLGLY